MCGGVVYGSVIDPSSNCDERSQEIRPAASYISVKTAARVVF